MKSWLRPFDVIAIIISALLLALSYHLFVFPNEFAPSGIPGIATMLQYLSNSKIKVGYITLLVNVPLTVAAYKVIGKHYAIRSAVFAVAFAACLLMLDYVDLSRFVYHTDNGTSAILGPIAAGVITGFCYSIVMRRNGSTGGTDFVVALVQHYKPEFSFLWLLFGFNACVAALSYFVYGFKIEPVILCIIYCYLSSEVTDTMLKGLKEAVKFEIITEHPEELSQELMKSLHRGVTEVPATGGFTHGNKTLLICIVGKRQIVQLQKILAKYPGSFAYLSSVKETVGNFRK